MTLCDYGTGHLSPFAILLALFHRLRTGEGQHVSASLSGTGLLSDTFHAGLEDVNKTFRAMEAGDVARTILMFGRSSSRILDEWDGSDSCRSVRRTLALRRNETLISEKMTKCS
jgi:CoA-transferase family III